MFNEHKCGCIWSIMQGRVRSCQSHKPEKAVGDGGGMPDGHKNKVIRHYPANGQEVYTWSGK